LDENGIKEVYGMKTIIKIKAEWNGSHSSLENVDYDLPGWAELPTTLADAWAIYAPFVNIILGDDGKISNISKGQEITPDPTPEPESKPTVEELANENKLLKAQLQAQTERSDFMEDCVAEMAEKVYATV